MFYVDFWYLSRVQLHENSLNNLRWLFLPTLNMVHTVTRSLFVSSALITLNIDCQKNSQKHAKYKKDLCLYSPQTEFKFNLKADLKAVRWWQNHARDQHKR